MHGGTIGTDGRGAPYSTAYLPQRPGGDMPAPPAGLSDLHGMPLFEFAVVDPEWAFLSWEVTAAQREASRLAYGDDWFAKRRLSVIVGNANHDHELARVDLYGDHGRWFMRLGAPGALAVARLGFEAQGARYELASAGPLQFPRTEPIEPEKYVELQVAYGVDFSGRLNIAAVRTRRASHFPVGAVPEQAPGGLQLAAGALPGSPGAPGSSPRSSQNGGRQ